jgi:hypothetical protein
MSYNIVATKKEGFLHLDITGINSAETVQAYLMDVRALCEKHHCSRVLIEEHLSGPGLPIMKIFEIVSRVSGLVLPAVQDVAYVDTNPEHERSRMQFAEDVAINRGINIKYCSTVSEAESFLRSLTPMKT